MCPILEHTNKKVINNCSGSGSNTSAGAGNTREALDALDDLIDNSSLYSQDALARRISQWIRGVYETPTADLEVPPTVHIWPQTVSSPVFSENIAGINNPPHTFLCTSGSYNEVQLPSYQETRYRSYTKEATLDNSLRNQDLEAASRSDHDNKHHAAQRNAHTQQLELHKETLSFADPKLENTNADIRTSFSANNNVRPPLRPRGRRAYRCTACAFSHIKCERSSGSNVCKYCTKRRLACEVKPRILQGQGSMFNEFPVKD